MTEEHKSEFLRSTYHPYIQSVIDHTSSTMGSADLISAASVFDPHHLPATEKELSDYGMDKIAKLTDFYGVAQKVNFDGQEGESDPDVDPDDTEAECKLFCLLILQYKDNSIHQVVKASF